jgi:chemotaxis protein MotA
MNRNITDLSTLIGISVALSLVALAIYLGGNVKAFVDIPSVLIVIGGTFMLTTASFTLPEIMHSQGLVFKTIFYAAEDPSRAAYTSLEIAEVARKKGILGMQNFDTIYSKNPFLRKGITYIIDGIAPEEAEAMLWQEIASMVDRHRKSISILLKSSEIAPAMGLIGTLIGLVQMLGQLDDPSTIGPAMAVALLTTFYGAMLSYAIFSPLASKLDRNSHDEKLVLEIYLQAIASIGRKDNPRKLEMLLNSMLPPARRVKYFS